MQPRPNQVDIQACMCLEELLKDGSTLTQRQWESIGMSESMLGSIGILESNELAILVVYDHNVALNH